MKKHVFRLAMFAGAWLTVCFSGWAQIVQLNATISGSQETPANSSTATGSAVMLYNVATNTFDLTVTLNNFTNTITASHFHEAAPGVAGSVVTNLGSEAQVYTRSGNNLTATFRGATYTGTPLTLLQKGAYVNFHSAAFPNGEIRGQMIPQPKRLTAIINGANEVPAKAVKGFGAAIVTYNPGNNLISFTISLYNFTNTFTLSHFHEAPIGVSGSIVHNIGGGTAYVQNGNAYSITVSNTPYLGDPIKLLTGGAYLNFHTNINPGGELRGQVLPSEEVPSSRLVTTSSRGFVGPGSQVLINGLAVSGTEPLRVLITARGPSLSSFGVSGVLPDPQLSVYDSTGTLLTSNDNFGTTFDAAIVNTLLYAPLNATEPALLIVLPPGTYTTVTGGAGTTSGIALTEAFDARSIDASAGVRVSSLLPNTTRAARAIFATRRQEICGAIPAK